MTGRPGSGWRQNVLFWRHWMDHARRRLQALAVLEGSDIWLRGEILRPDGSEVIRGDIRASIADGADAGRSLAAELLGQAPKGFFSWR